MTEHLLWEMSEGLFCSLLCLNNLVNFVATEGGGVGYEGPGPPDIDKRGSGTA